MSTLAISRIGFGQSEGLISSAAKIENGQVSLQLLEALATMSKKTAAIETPDFCPENGVRAVAVDVTE